MKYQEIQYNLLNLPSRITYSDGRMADYVYSATGTKLSVTYTNGGTTTNNQYCGNMLYENGTLKQILIDGGYITFNGSTPQYHFYLKDHLGNNRVVVNASGTVEQVTHYYPFGGLMGESTNGDIQRYKYNGKELDRMNGLDWYDYGARHMDGIRFTTIDPMAEKYYGVSPYVYCKDNPVKYVDPDGKKIVLAKNVSNRFKNDYELTVKTLQEKGCGDVWNKLNSSDIIYTITEGEDNSNYFDSSNKTISWNARMGLYTSHDVYLSPATRLNHELDHALQYDNNPKQYEKDTNTFVGSIDETYSKEEQRVIQGIERQTAEKLGEISSGDITRDNHSGIPFVTDSPISNKELNSSEVTIFPQKK